MPFGAGFDGIYNSFLKPTAEEAGFSVTRADELSGSENRVNTIIRGLEECCVVIADLTDSNPNVYYELALAHSMHKPVISLTQNVDELPFDIKTHGVIEYSRDFELMDDARKKLQAYASGVLTGETPFGNPFSDYKGIDISPDCAERSVESSQISELQDSEAGDEPPGLFEHQAAVEEGFERLRTSTESIGARTRQASGQLGSITNQLQESSDSAQPRPDALRHRRQLAMILATELNSYGRFLGQENGTYAEIVDTTRPALEASLRAAEPESDEDYDALEELYQTIESVERTTVLFRDNIDAAAAASADMPHMERSLTRSRNLVVEQLNRLSGNIEQLLAMLARAKSILESKRRSTSE